MQKISEAIVAGSLEAISKDTERERKIKDKYGEDARRVDPYRPNRKQRRAQAAKERNK